MKGKKLIFLLFLFLLPSETGAQMSKIPPWRDFYVECFEASAQIAPQTSGEIKVKIKPRTDLIFVQDNNFLLNKIYENGGEKYLDYQVISLEGVLAEDKDQIKFLNDNNQTTGLSFDPFSLKAKEIIVDLGGSRPANTIKFNLVYDGLYEPFYYISLDNNQYIQVENPSAFSFRFLKIIFQSINKKVQGNLRVNELNFIEPGKTVYLVKLNSTSTVNIFSGYQCVSKTFFKIIKDLKNASAQTTFRIDASTPLYEVDWQDNPNYNNDFDGDGVLNNIDNCPFKSNPDQSDIDSDLKGDVCDLNNEVKNYNEKDTDQDGIPDSLDNCPFIYNPKQIDSNADKKGDLCSDDDKDGVIGYRDNCLYVYNPGQEDINANGVGDACEFDKDKDGIFDSIDNCINTFNPGQNDQDDDGIGDACDNCELYNPRQLDKNNNGRGDACEENEKFWQNNDKDKDGVLDVQDNCPNASNPNQLDKDNDGVGDACDNCPALKNPKQVDENKNGVGDKCEDIDGDGVVGYLDNCPSVANSNQADADNDGRGDVCEDEDGDGVLAYKDNCPYDYNKDQSDIDHDGIGDACDGKDDRFLESNKGLFIGFIVLVTFIFAIFIGLMIKKIRSSEKKVEVEKDVKENAKDN